MVALVAILTTAVGCGKAAQDTVGSRKVRIMGNNISLSVGTASGTLLSVLPNIHSEDYVKTIVLAIIGAAVGAVASMRLRRF